MSIKTITTDKAKAKNLFQNALGFLDTLKLIQVHAFDELRRVRNDINYYGQKNKETLEDFYERNKEIITTTREGLLKILRQKLSN